MKYLTLLVLTLVACADPAVAPPAPQHPQFSFGGDAPAAPSDLSVITIEKAKQHFLVTIQWTDNAVGEFNTCFHFSDAAGACAYAAEYGAGTGVRTFTMRVPRGTYTLTALAWNYVEIGDGFRVSVPSAPSAPIVVEVR